MYICNDYHSLALRGRKASQKKRSCLVEMTCVAQRGLNLHAYHQMSGDSCWMRHCHVFESRNGKFYKIVHDLQKKIKTFIWKVVRLATGTCDPPCSLWIPQISELVRTWSDQASWTEICVLQVVLFWNFVADLASIALQFLNTRALLVINLLKWIKVKSLFSSIVTNTLDANWSCVSKRPLMWLKKNFPRSNQLKIFMLCSTAI